MKKCNKCGLDKPIEHFGKHDWCKLCKAAYNKKWKNNNKDKVNNYQKKYSEKNKSIFSSCIILRIITFPFFSSIFFLLLQNGCYYLSGPFRPRVF